ncbi:hypothetical protein LZC95_17305 [Pendulispora brunnea]|uniref:Uncharacterized protein n=1 Tax=Pendulispora brunnea TaxID=2905690 RepID=A0ABZ2KJ48_9BACT
MTHEDDVDRSLRRCRDGGKRRRDAGERRQVSGKGCRDHRGVPALRRGGLRVHRTSDAQGNVWVAEFFARKIAKVTTSGVITEYPLATTAGRPIALTPGPDRRISEADANKVARITPAGILTEFALPNAGASPNGARLGRVRAVTTH